MAITIAKYGATCINVEPANEKAALRWQPWHKQLIGKHGQLAICTLSIDSEARFLCFEMADLDEDILETAFGAVSIEGNMLTFVSKNSHYVFAIQEQMFQSLILKGEQ